jgi:hypothetical protein
MARLHRDIGVTDSGASNFHDDLVGRGHCEVDGFEAERFADLMYDCGSDFHVDSL